MQRKNKNWFVGLGASFFVLSMLSMGVLGCEKNTRKEYAETKEPAPAEKPVQTAEPKPVEPQAAAKPAPAPEGSDKGVGPVKELKLSATVDKALATKGEELFKGKCVSCHKMDEKLVGPALKGITLRRKPEWIMNMILNPLEMTQKDETAKALLAQFSFPMTPQNLSEPEARSLVEYFRQVDSAK